MPTSHKRRILYTADARLTVARAARRTTHAAGPAPAAGDVPEKIATVAGYAIVWNALSDDRGGYRVRLLPGSAKFTTPAHALLHHDFSKVLGTTRNGSLRVASDAYGVRVEIDLPDTSDGRDVEELIEGRYVEGMSFSMVDAPAGELVTENGGKVLNVTAFTCDEVTITAIPAFTDTSVGIEEDDEPEDEPPAAAAGFSARQRQTIQLARFRIGQFRQYRDGLPAALK
jgi:HK97 family phage prohead protease